MNIIARDTEIKDLKSLYDSSVPEFMALYGRRRVGKTFLIRTFFLAQKGAVFFDVTGTKGSPKKEQIKHFTAQLSKIFYGGAKLQPEKDWDDTFELLTKAINAQVTKNKKIVLFFDEIPWMATRKSRLLESLDYYWNQYWSQDKRIKLIICGSSASWIINKIIHNKGGLHNRITREMHLEPFNLSQMKVFLRHKNVNLNDRQILQLYMVMGGVPYYLTKVEKGLSATQIIEKLAFSKNAFLLEEFDKLFYSLFDNSDDYLAIVRLLAKSRGGIGERELLKQIRKNILGAQGKKILRDLEKTGFIMRFKPLYHKKRGAYYRLKDEYTIFYLKWIEPIRESLEQHALEEYRWQEIQTTPEWYSWQGYTFESVCYKHLANIKKALNLGPTALSSSWRYVPVSQSKENGAQIDLLFDRKDDAITICEIKYTDKPFVITKDCFEAIKRKIDVFKTQTRSKKQFLVVFISANGVKNNSYAENLLSNVVTLDDLFKGKG
jgi:uncharacterized protein